MPTDQPTTSPDSDTERKAKTAARGKRYYEANKEHVLARNAANYKARPRTDESRAQEAERMKAWRKANPGKSADYDKRWREANLEKKRARDKAYREANPEKRKARHRAYCEAHRETVLAQMRSWHEANKGRRYGLTRKEYGDMVAACNGRCPCCRVPFSAILGELPCVDHDHKKGMTRDAVRGIICHRCNRLLGHANDDPRVLRACARHLERLR